MNLLDNTFTWDEPPRLFLLCCVAFAFFGVSQFIKAYKVRANLAHIPSVGHSGWLSSYLTVFRFAGDPAGVCQEGYAKFKGMPYKIPTVNGWHVIISDNTMIDEFRKLPDETLSIYEGFEQALHLSYTSSPDLLNNPYQVAVVRNTLTRNITACYADLHEEIRIAVKAEIPLKTDWVEIDTFATIVSIFAQSNNRILVGYPLCRNADYLDLVKNFATSIILNASIIHLFPEILHPIVGQIFTSRRRTQRRVMKHLKPIVEERIEMLNKYGKDWPEKPNDYMTWLLNDPHAQDWQRSVADISIRLLDANFASIHTTSSTFTHILYYLAAHPDLLQPLRAEVEMNVQQYGWTKVAMREMHFMDSFMKEANRLTGITIPTSSIRRVLRDFSFSDGTAIPAGTIISLGSFSKHHDEELYPSSEKFEPSRFSDKRAKEGEGIKHGMATPANDWLLFGSGRHACPGRFFAVTTLKTLLAHIILNYDVKMKDDGGVPPCTVFAGSVAPNVTAKVMFRKRQM